jgi:hypothetical protein
MDIMKLFNKSKLETVLFGASVSHLESIINLSQLDIGYIPWSSSSMTPRAITLILNEIILNKKSRVLELGMGISTLYITSLMKEEAHLKLVSIDNDESWIRTCHNLLASKHLETTRHRIINAPLKKLKEDDCETLEYYDLAPHADVLSNFKPDLLIVDGPPAWRPEIAEARIPAYRFLSPLLSPNATVIIDDYKRSGESKLLDLFLSTPGWSLAFDDPKANVAILRSSISTTNVF